VGQSVADASWMIAAGVPLPVIHAHLGHESIQTTIGVYGHLDRRSAQAAAGQALCPSVPEGFQVATRAAARQTPDLSHVIPPHRIGI
jgi:hypothetical protein